MGGTAADQNVTPELVANYNVVRLREPDDFHWMSVTAIPYASAQNGEPAFTSSNPSVIRCWDLSTDAYMGSNGFVKAVSKGSATVTATAKDGCSCSFTVIADFSAQQPVQVQRITLSASSATLAAINQTYRIAADVYPANAADRSVAWTSSNTAVATVANGLVTARGNGTATITARTANGLTATARVTVSIPVAPASVKINQGAFTLTKKSSYKKLTATVSPSNATNKAVTWSTSNPKVAKVDSAGKVTPVKNGTAYITAKTSNGKTAKVKVTVKIVCPSSVKITTKDFTLTKKGATKAVKATVSPSSATDKTVTWSSSNSKVATVSSTGKVTAVGNGTATITAKSSNGRTAKVTVKVSIASASTKPGAYGMNADEYAVAKDIFNAYNNYRASRGYNRVKFDGGLCSWGVKVAKHCASVGKLEHWIAKIQTSRTESFSDILQYSTWKMKGTEAVQRWSKSNGHRKMMQCASATKAGVGVYKSGGTWYYAIVYDYKGTNQSGS